MANAAPCAAADAQTPITQIDFARAGVGTESHFRVEKGVRLAIIGSGIHPT